MDCPRCALPLKTVDYEGVETDMCEACWGFWLDTGELEIILSTHALQFSDDEREAILSTRTASRAGNQTAANCPHCDVEMQRAHIDESVHLVIDRCPDHGVWLDSGEIKRVQALAESSQRVHRLLIQKLGAKKKTT